MKHINVLILILMMVSQGVDAKKPLAADTLTLDAAVALAITSNPELRSLSFEIDKAQSRTLQTGLAPNHEITVGVDDFGGSGKFRGFDSVEKSVLVSREIQRGDKRRKRTVAAKLEEEMIRWDIRQRELDITRDVTRAFYRVLGSRQLLDLNTELTTLAEQVFQTVQERVSAGKVSPLEGIKAKANLDYQRIEQRRLEKEHTVSRRELSSLIGRRQSSAAINGDGENLEPLPAADELLALIANNPDLARFQTEADRRQAVLIREQSQQVSDLTMAGGIKDVREKEAETAEHDYAFVIEFSLPFKIADKNQGAIREAQQHLAQIKPEREAVEITIRRELQTYHEEAVGLLGQIAALKTDILPALENVFNSMQEGYRHGKFTYLEVLDAQRSFFESRSQYLEAVMAYHLVYADIKRLAGDSVPAAANHNRRNEQ